MKKYKDLVVEYWDVERLIPYARNPRKNEEAAQKLAGVIAEFGFQVPIIIRGTGEVIDGHARLKAASILGIKKVPVIINDEWTETQAKAFRLSVNKSAEWAEWDDELLKLELQDLSLENFDLELIGFNDVDISAGSVEGLTDPDEVPEVPEQPISQQGDVWVCGDHRVMCGDSTSFEDMERLCNGEKVDMWLTDPPYNVNYTGGTGMTIQNDNMGDGEFRQFLRDAYSTADGVMKPGAVFYIWHADSEGYNFRGAAKDIGWTVRQCLIWKKDKLVLGRQDYHWAHEPCQPAGTKVLTPDGEKPIESLKDGDSVISYDSYSGQIVGYKRNACKIKTANRFYEGLLYGVHVDGNLTWCTNNHEFSVRFNANNKEKYCTYLMKRDNWWRVGIARTYDARQFGLKTRLHQEKADAVWLLEMHSDKIAAQVAEQILCVKYGIPYTVWEQDRFSVVSRSQEQIKKIYDALDLNLLEANAKKLLADMHRDFDYPLITKSSQRHKFSTRVTAKINACNLVPGLMLVPVPVKPNATPNFKWCEITSVAHQPFCGTVYSLAVEKHQHYVADGIVTHNCLYGWKDGASHLWASDRKQTTILEFYRPPHSELHPTMKPVALIEYEMLNNTKGADVVLDSFGGSGTTLIAAEKNGRRARLMELDPKYCDVIVKRWQDFTGDKAILEGDGRTFAEFAEIRTKS